MFTKKQKRNSVNINSQVLTNPKILQILQEKKKKQKKKEIKKKKKRTREN
jgi:hypothetical protein